MFQETEHEKIGSTISHYQILAKLGAGGMGVVYKARDLKLNRLVAIKFLSPELTLDKDAIARFVHEAQTVSALNHPNICTIHEIDECNGTHFMVMEFIDGETLHGISASRGALPLTEILDIIIKVADALKAAHAKGIIHRDIKPDNIMISREGYVKVMDFGLAKLKSGAELVPSETEPRIADSSPSDYSPYSVSSLYGTDAYMSPEQIERSPLDERSDVFSLGVVIYEMVAGRKPFVGYDDIAVMKSILNDEPQLPTSSEHHSYSELNRVILKALAKKPGDRHACMAEFYADLKKLQNLSTKRSVSDRPKIIYRSVAAILILIIIGLIVLLSQLSGSKGEQFPAPTALKMYSIGTTSEIEGSPAFSPDDKKVMFSSRTIGLPVNYTMNWIKELESGAMTKVVEWGTASSWSPDGSRIAYANQDGIFIYDLNQLNSIQITKFGIMPKWSPNGQEIVFFSNTGGLPTEQSAIFLYHFKSATWQQISPLNGLQFAHPYWSPDGRWIICTGGEGSRKDFWLIEAATSKARTISNVGHWINNPVWCPSGQFIYYLSNQNGTFDIWRVPIDLKNGHLIEKPIQITTGLEVTSLEISHDGNKLIFARNETKEQIWCVPLNGSADALSKAKVVMSNLSGTENIEISPDGSQMVLETTYGGVRSLMLKSLRDNTEKVLYKEQPTFAPTWSADGKWIAFDAGGGNNADIWRIAVAGGQAEKIIANNSADWSPTYSPDGNYLCYLSNRNKQFDLWIHDLKTGTAQPVTNSPGSKSRGFWSHDAQKLAYYENCFEESCCRIFIYELSAQKIKELLYIPDRRSTITDKLVWKADDTALYYLFRAWLPLCEISIKTKQVKTVLNFKQGELTPSGNRVFAVYNNLLYFVSSNEAADIWIAEGLR